MSGIEDNAEKVGVEAYTCTYMYVLKKISKDLPLHPILIALKWDHLSDLKLADSDFRTPAHIDLKYSRTFFVMDGGLDLKARHLQVILALDGYSLERFMVVMW